MERIKERYLTDPEYRAKRLKISAEATMRRYHSDPEYRRQHNEKAAVRLKERYHSDPEYRERVLRLKRERRKKAKEKSSEA